MEYPGELREAFRISHFWTRRQAFTSLSVSIVAYCLLSWSQGKRAADMGAYLLCLIGAFAIVSALQLVWNFIFVVPRKLYKQQRIDHQEAIEKLATCLFCLDYEQKWKDWQSQIPMVPQPTQDFYEWFFRSAGIEYDPKLKPPLKELGSIPVR